ncbi:MAG TPA: diacylglycerol kinase family protein [Pseudogracilibacillus sp.]|nr:diacylglycerol kinase family protein [Pseudogracilibacillus sp.]
MKDKKKTSIGFRYAFNGIKEAFLRERNFRIHLYITSIVLILSFYFQLNVTEWILILIAIYFVLVMELVNSLFERIIDYIKPEYHIQAKIIKDIAAGVVLLTASLSIIIGLIIFLPKFF